MLKGLPAKHHSILGKFLQIYILSSSEHYLLCPEAVRRSWWEQTVSLLIFGRLKYQGEECNGANFGFRLY